jgi:hypothetical protein
MSFVDRFVSEQRLQIDDADMHLDAETNEFRRADLVLYGVDHSRESYEGRVFFNNPDADRDTETTAEHGYAGSFYVFGHERCVGDAGHCNPDWGAAEDALDYRRPHHMEAHDKVIKVTEALERLAAEAATGVQLTVVAIPADVYGEDREPRPLLRFESVRLLTYGP